MENLTITPVGTIHTSKKAKFDVPHQPKNSSEQQNKIELFPGKNYEHALRDLEGFDRIWLIWWFHRNPNWKPLVLPPRGIAKRRGVFATRSPHRPNPIGITAVPLIKVEGRTLIVGNTDLIDGTPILDIKPYLITADSFPDARLGWLQEVEEQNQQEPSYQILVSDLAREQIEWLKNSYEIDFTVRAFELLSRDPTPHRTRRIVKVKNDEFRMGCGAWRLFFTIADQSVSIVRIAPGYPRDSLIGTKSNAVPDRDAQYAFEDVWNR